MQSARSAVRRQWLKRHFPIASNATKMARWYRWTVAQSTSIVKSARPFAGDSISPRSYAPPHGRLVLLARDLQERATVRDLLRATRRERMARLLETTAGNLPSNHQRIGGTRSSSRVSGRAQAQRSALHLLISRVMNLRPAPHLTVFL